MLTLICQQNFSWQDKLGAALRTNRILAISCRKNYPEITFVHQTLQIDMSTEFPFPPQSPINAPFHDTKNIWQNHLELFPPLIFQFLQLQHILCRAGPTRPSILSRQSHVRQP
jgi:hypothetical protein